MKIQLAVLLKSHVEIVFCVTLINQSVPQASVVPQAVSFSQHTPANEEKNMQQKINPRNIGSGMKRGIFSSPFLRHARVFHLSPFLSILLVVHYLDMYYKKTRIRGILCSFTTLSHDGCPPLVVLVRMLLMLVRMQVRMQATSTFSLTINFFFSNFKYMFKFISQF